MENIQESLDAIGIFQFYIKLNMGNYDIMLDEYSQKLCMIFLPWVKYKYWILNMGNYIDLDVFQEKMSMLFQ